VVDALKISHSYQTLINTLHVMCMFMYINQYIATQLLKNNVIRMEMKDVLIRFSRTNPQKLQMAFYTINF